MLAVVETARGAKDEVVIAFARREKRVLRTEDKDFGQLVYAAGEGTCGVILFRFPASARAAQQGAALEVVTRFGARLSSSFVVVEPGRARASTLARG